MTCPMIGTDQECPKIGTEKECVIDGQLCSSRGRDMKADGVDILWTNSMVTSRSRRSEWARPRRSGPY